MQGLSIGWGTGGHAELDAIQATTNPRTNFLDVWLIKARPASDYARGYLGPLNPAWHSPTEPRKEVAERWIGMEERRRPQFKQPLQDMEHDSVINLRNHVASQIRQALEGNKLGVNPDEVIPDLFSTMRAPLTGYRKMIWTTAMLDDGHWNNKDPEKAREPMVANVFRKNNPNIPIRVMVYDVPMTHYGHIEKPREMAGGMLTALKWLAAPQ